MGNSAIIELRTKLNGMKRMLPEGFKDEKQAAAYFEEKENILENIVKTIEKIDTASTTETEGIKEAVKSFRDLLKHTTANPQELTRKQIEFQMGKALFAAWNRNQNVLGELKCCPNLKNENWNNPSDFNWSVEKGFTVQKSTLLGDPVGNVATNDQYLINPVYEEAIMSDAMKISVMMPLVTNRPMKSKSIFIPERDRGGVTLNWLTAYGQKILSSKPNAATRTELKAYTLAGFIPWYDEFDEDSFADLGKIFIEEFTESYGQEFDKQCLISDSSPFTGVFKDVNITKHEVDADITKLTYTDFRDAEIKVPAEERKNCRWFFNESVLNQITNITDTNGNPIWRKPGDDMPGMVDGYKYHECTILPQYSEITDDMAFAVFMDPKRIYHGNRKGIEIKRFEDTTESLEYGELFLRFRKRSGFLVTRSKNNMVLLKTAAE
jgi:HK97 family phage major capsid protein